MNLETMLSIQADEETMLLLPLEAVVLIKGVIVSSSKAENYHFIREFFAPENYSQLDPCIMNLNKTVVYDFESTIVDNEKFISIFEWNATVTYQDIHDLLEELVHKYKDLVDVVFEFYTHDLHVYRMTDYDGNINTVTLK